MERGRSETTSRTSGFGTSNILIVGYYHLSDGFLAAAKAMMERGNTVSFFPMYRYRQDVVDSRNDYVDLLIEATRGANVVLWWYHPDNLSVEEVTRVITVGGKKHVHFNWDIRHPSSKRETILAMMDLNLTVNPLELTVYPEFRFCPPGFHPSTHYRSPDPNYRCDVSIVCTNLYEDDEWPQRYQRCPRKVLVDQLDAHPTIIFHLYGPVKFQARYPKSYRGSIPYNESRLVFSNSQLNLCLNCTSIDGYISERVPLVMACGGVVYADSQIGLGAADGRDYVLVDARDPLRHIEALLQRPDELAAIGCSAAKFAAERLTWANLAAVVT